MTAAAPEVKKLYISYNNIHKLCQETAEKLKAESNKPDIIIAIGGGGFIPARILRSFIREQGEKNIPIQAIGLSLYESMGNNSTIDTIGKEVVRTQWLDFGAIDKHFDTLIGKKILIVDEVDDTRTTLYYALTELKKDVRNQAIKLGRSDEKTIFSVFVLHNKDKPKKEDLPKELMDSGRYLAARTVPDIWIAYPWDASDIDYHTEMAKTQGNI
ncbi:xanthine phosphoribosyltransferase [Ascoidea rubescens DSM 1968]|uniref:PRTase-like protein n=1 Tax=Ascoidea rubescens DSM 1968 TaxID=1344418 RepID=A0A1D2VEJ4_9ASCO|nr:PRTase-like protein [Ascoidea rubescens DSM 1968]ODV59887.1 PRTase-like protein [Ascoidea rubescens DSM 1968]